MNNTLYFYDIKFCFREYEKICETFLWKDIYIGGRELGAAISASQYEIIETLINRGVSKEQDKRDSVSPLICAIRTGTLRILTLFYEEGPKRPSLIYNPGILHSPSAYAAALAVGVPEIVEYLEVCIDRDGGGPQTTESATDADKARNVLGSMSNIYHQDGYIPKAEETQAKCTLVHQIALHLLPSAGGDLELGRICKLVEKAPEIQTMDLLGKALPPLLRTIREEADPQKRAFFLETLEVVINDQIASQLSKLRERQPSVADEVDQRTGKLDKALSHLWFVARENIDNDEMDRVMMVISRLLRF
ncbi:hypothetical protein PEX1_046740 [Penicillium expansum]|uniref:Uncharacterized protein n=1 Tax=Penicillium expansum TaxID=27334 RepID=A0A0A2JPG9_PENEN|nr:hypothetical protein PEX2_002580 [Penicillium expansum]KGO45485.1 hypothetical protein PEXP_061130 [Penicillium expansum]KGO57284.1 hypothetical protein PEX2_002580 [Penicillium expansum]KGO70830.1 hypothetical protein PEX1_046740 [Penicillium expansum]